MINAIPLATHQTPDKFFWYFPITGAYMVRSGYNLAMDINVLEDELVTSHASSSLHHNPICKKLCHPKLLNKIKIFLWKACLDIISTCLGIKSVIIIYFQVETGGCTLMNSGDDSLLEERRDRAG
ncbi:hypothetical protein ACH5RR_013215 [Cinchona calisaya]|uniref:Reverse transcriptase zinc-binding domain-containing protein n=1 Tax=Cinchona calisaya TaxID=153742 RepID=A0ABD3A0R9_9GENT